MAPFSHFNNFYFVYYCSVLRFGPFQVNPTSFSSAVTNIKRSTTIWMHLIGDIKVSTQLGRKHYWDTIFRVKKSQLSSQWSGCSYNSKATNKGGDAMATTGKSSKEIWCNGANTATKMQCKTFLNLSLNNNTTTRALTKAAKSRLQFAAYRHQTAFIPAEWVWPAEAVKKVKTHSESTRLIWCNVLL